MKPSQGSSTDKWVTHSLQHWSCSLAEASRAWQAFAEALPDEFKTVVQAITCPTYNPQWSGNHAYLPTLNNPFTVQESKEGVIWPGCNTLT